MKSEIVKGFDEELYREIARKCSSKQLIKDVSFARAMNFRAPQLMYAERIPNKAICMGQAGKNRFRIIGIGVVDSEKGKGVGTFLLKRMEEFAKRAVHLKSQRRQKVEEIFI